MNTTSGFPIHIYGSRERQDNNFDRKEKVAILKVRFQLQSHEPRLNTDYHL